MEAKIAFGTGGLRGIMGDESGCINHHVIQHVTHGLTKIILTDDAPKSVGVAYDTRFKSDEFAQIVCDVLSAFGINVYIFDRPMPTPMLSHAIRLMNLGWGVCITASHNPQEYNGYKVYDFNGVQVTDYLAARIANSINSLAENESVPDIKKDLIKIFDNRVIDAYFKQIINFVGVETEQKPFPIVYSALYGAGANVVPIVLEKLGFSPVCIQQEADGAFGGLKTPNPEEPTVFKAALIEAEKKGATLILATDPDCDRVGVMVRTKQGFELLSGNQIGALLIDYLAQTRGCKPGDTVISTIVSGQLGEFVAKSYGLEFVRLLTGFKYIGEYIVNLPEDKQFFFGYEESYGFLAGDGARDKDAVIASALIVKMAAYYDTKEMSLLDRWHELCEKHGYCLEVLHSFDVSQDKQHEIMKQLRNDTIDGATRRDDYLDGINGLPVANVMKIYFENPDNAIVYDNWVAVRPSGTESKLKTYIGVCTRTYKEAKDSLVELKDRIRQTLKMT